MQLKRRAKIAFAAMTGLLAAALSPTTFAGEVIRDQFVSATLGRAIPFTVYLPDGYKEAAQPFPVTYLLHGAGGDESEWVAKGSAGHTLDGLIKRGLMRPTVAIMPTFGPASWWADGASERDETAFMTELIPYVESRYKVAAERGARSIGGLSMGGYGSLNLALKHPDRFCAAAIISPAIYDPLPPETSAARRTPQFVRDGRFDPDTWKALNYPAHLEAYQKGQERVPMWIVSGDHDKFGIALMSAQVFWRLFQIQPKQVELRVIDGDHEWMTFRDALPDALQYVDAQCARGSIR
ncbi:alpha/beta hydrolase [Noviherbaspirillum galbum]|uniref:Esterase family protein n=1 Tax=Noviherbaspirillum galbum TaxID=2709383 RepID=A0A6B3STS0_9BURK|nr:alpha/beta hydrolase-fold protein [Noviherbaspirillum galbum]NEX61029.1 esterase family protein [Noviherbaspirillum galbum]